MINKKPDSKKKTKELVDQAAERLAQIFIQQIELGKNKKQKYIIFSVIGVHAHESKQEIFKRKIEDINKTGFTFWLYKSIQANPIIVQDFCRRAKKENEDVFCVFIEPSTPGGAQPTKINASAKIYSVNNSKWTALPKGLSPVTGDTNKGAYALILDSLIEIDGIVNLWEYADSLTRKAIKISLGNSTLCAVRKNTIGEANKIKSPNRKIIAVGKLQEPYCVWLR